MKTWEWIVLFFCAAIIILTSGKGGSIFAPPPFKADKLSVLIVEESLEHGKYTSDQLNAIQSTDAKSPRGIVQSAGGEFQVIDESTPADKLATYRPWVQEAFKVKREGRPWVVAASPKSGFSMALPSEAELVKRIEGLR